MENKFLIDYQTGAGNEEAATIEEAKALAVEGLAFTQESVIIRDLETNESVAKLPWYKTAAEEDDEVTESFGDLGFYGVWID